MFWVNYLFTLRQIPTSYWWFWQAGFIVSLVLIGVAFLPRRLGCILQHMKQTTIRDTLTHIRIICSATRGFPFFCMTSAHPLSIQWKNTLTHTYNIPPNTAGFLCASSGAFWFTFKNCDRAIKLSAHRLMMEGQHRRKQPEVLTTASPQSSVDAILWLSGLYKHIKLWIIQENKISRLNAFCWWNLDLTLAFSSQAFKSFFFKLKLMIKLCGCHKHSTEGELNKPMCRLLCSIMQALTKTWAKQETNHQWPEQTTKLNKRQRKQEG